MRSRPLLPITAAAGLTAAMALLTSCATAKPTATGQPPVANGYGAAPSATAAACPTNVPATSPVEIKIVNMRFVPDTVQVKVCQPVHVANTDEVKHTWTASPGPFASPTLNKNESFDYQFTAKGTFSFVCRFHTFMTGTITVS